MMDRDRRQDRRLEIRLPLECHGVGTGAGPAWRSSTRNISTGGVYFEADVSDGLPPATNSLLSVELTVPPGEGHFPYEGRVRGLVEVLRCEPLDSADAASGAGRVGVAARFKEPLELVF
jgi:hypothetical protein